MLETYIFQVYSKWLTYNVTYNGEMNLTHICIICGTIYIYMLMENSIYIIGDIYRYIYFVTYKDKPHTCMYYMWNHIYLILENSIYMLETYIYLSYILYWEHVIHGEANRISTYIICRASYNTVALIVKLIPPI